MCAMKHILGMFRRAVRLPDRPDSDFPPAVASLAAAPEEDGWWERSLSWEERNLIEDAFKPMGNITARSMVESSSPQGIGNLIGHLKKEDIRHLGYLLIARGDELVHEQTPVMERHFFFAQAGGFYYRWRDHDSFALERAIDYFERQIAIAPEAAAKFLEPENLDFIPAHAGYRQLRIIFEKQGQFGKARDLCLKAKTQGWADDWDKHIARIDKKAV